MAFEKITEHPSLYHHLEKMSTRELLENINCEDQRVAPAVASVIPHIELLVNTIVTKLQAGGRLFYIGAGTSGRLGVLDASECPPTYGVSESLITGVIAGGDSALRKSVENAEDDLQQGWDDLKMFEPTDNDLIIGIAASGTTPYVLGALQKAKLHGITTGCIVCNANSPIGAASNHPIEIVVGPEFVSGSTRMKAGTAQKLVLNMISTSVMIRLGYVEDNLMVNMKINNVKLLDRAVGIILTKTGSKNYNAAKNSLIKGGSINAAIALMVEDLYQNQ